MHDRERDQAALDFATAKQAGQKRKSTGEPYIVHPVAVADLVRGTGARDAVIARVRMWSEGRVRRRNNMKA